MEPIKVIGTSDLDSSEKETVNRLANLYYPKIQRALHNDTSIIIHVKIYGKGEKRKKYSINVRAIAPTRILESGRASDWDLARTLHKALDEVRSQIGHVFKKEPGYKKRMPEDVL